ncbi:MAG: hypothetical protein AAGA30_10155 [Planctomycetota bacterium]
MGELKDMFKKGLYELGQGLRALPEAIYLAPEYQSQSMDERQTSYLEQQQDGIEVPEQQQERQVER